MKRIVVTFLSLCLLASAHTALADRNGGGKPPGNPDGAICRASKNCAGKVCVKANPKDRTGICCTPTTCEQLSATCGSIDSCGTPVGCGDCGFDESCIDNQCQSNTTTTTTTTSTTSTTLADNPCDPNPCTSCGPFGFFWCGYYIDSGEQYCAFNQGTSGGGCTTDENCGGDGWRCAYNSFDGANHCVNVTGYCPN